MIIFLKDEKAKVWVITYMINPPKMEDLFDWRRKSFLEVFRVFLVFGKKSDLFFSGSLYSFFDEDFYVF